MYRKLTISKFLDEVASESPTPGGGSVAAISGAQAAALIEMVCALTLKHESYKSVHKKVLSFKKESNLLRKKMYTLCDSDAKSFNAVIKAYKSKDAGGIQKTLKGATEVPLLTYKIAIRLEQIASDLVRTGNRNAVSDAKSALYLAKAAKQSALENVKINLKEINEKKFIEKVNRLILYR